MVLREMIPPSASLTSAILSLFAMTVLGMFSVTLAASDRGRISGIDVSHYQGQVNWNTAAKSGIQFAFIKATQGEGDVDPEFARNWTASAEAGVVRGAYHFFMPGEDAKSQAEHFLKTVGDYGQALPPALDIEVDQDVPPATYAAAIRTWVTVVEEALGCKPIIYTDRPFWNEHVNMNFDGYPLWLADYTAKPTLPDGWTQWVFWQHSDKGNVPGIVGNVDQNFFNGDTADVQQLRCVGAE